MPIAVTAIAATAAVVVLMLYGVVSHVDLADASPESAETSFEQARDRFLGSEPLVRLVREQGDVRGEVRRRAFPSEIRPNTLHLMI